MKKAGLIHCRGNTMNICNKSASCLGDSLPINGSKHKGIQLEGISKVVLVY